MIAIIDYDIGNVAAVRNILTRLGHDSVITSNADDIRSASHIILPGTGSFDSCMTQLTASGLIPIIEKRIQGGNIPLLGICVGAQMLGRGSAEGQLAGLGWLDMDVCRLEVSSPLNVPHMSWAYVTAKQSQHPLAANPGLNEAERFYFVHSYFMKPDRAEDWLYEADYGGPFCAAAAQGTIAAVQFHPEKSHRFGKGLLSRFATWEAGQ